MVAEIGYRLASRPPEVLRPVLGGDGHATCVRACVKIDHRRLPACQGMCAAKFSKQTKTRVLAPTLLRGLKDGFVPVRAKSLAALSVMCAQVSRLCAVMRGRSTLLEGSSWGALTE
eukprot:COSAG01_NODE_6432_length_3670_cov_2.259871_2_plen_116_part_00